MPSHKVRSDIAKQLAQRKEKRAAKEAKRTEQKPKDNRQNSIPDVQICRGGSRLPAQTQSGPNKETTTGKSEGNDTGESLEANTFNQVVRKRSLKAVNLMLTFDVRNLNGKAFTFLAAPVIVPARKVKTLRKLKQKAAYHLAKFVKDAGLDAVEKGTCDGAKLRIEADDSHKVHVGDVVYTGIENEVGWEEWRRKNVACGKVNMLSVWISYTINDCSN